MPEPTEVQAYAYASCQGCSWKLSRQGDDVTASTVREQAIQHAMHEGHQMIITENRCIVYDFRVERPT